MICALVVRFNIKQPLCEYLRWPIWKECRLGRRAWRVGCWETGRAQLAAPAQCRDTGLQTSRRLPELVWLVRNLSAKWTWRACRVGHDHAVHVWKSSDIGSLPRHTRWHVNRSHVSRLEIWTDDSLTAVAEGGRKEGRTTLTARRLPNRDARRKAERRRKLILYISFYRKATPSGSVKWHRVNRKASPSHSKVTEELRIFTNTSDFCATENARKVLRG